MLNAYVSFSAKTNCIYELLALCFVYIKLSIKKTLFIYDFLAIFMVYGELSTKKLCIYVVCNAVCICKVFSKRKNCIYELMAMSFVYIKVSTQKNLSLNEFLAMVIVFF